MPKVKKVNDIDSPEFRGTRRVCPTCENRLQDFTCPTCFGTGVVHLEMYCEFCGRSIQFVYKGRLVCGSSLCQSEIDKLIKENKYTPSIPGGSSEEDYAKLFGLCY